MKTSIIQKWASHGFTDAAKAQHVLWNAGSYGTTAIQFNFRTKYGMSAPARSGIPGLYKDYQSKVSIRTWFEMDVHKSVMKRKN